MALVIFLSPVLTVLLHDLLMLTTRRFFVDEGFFDWVYRLGWL